MIENIDFIVQEIRRQFPNAESLDIEIIPKKDSYIKVPYFGESQIKTIKINLKDMPNYKYSFIKKINTLIDIVTISIIILVVTILLMLGLSQ